MNGLLFVEAPLPGFFGSTALYACLPSMPGPVGFAWLRFPSVNYTELLYIFVHDDFRRSGVGTSLLTELRAKRPAHTVISAKETSFSGPWMTKNGFVKTTNGWVLAPDPK